MIELETKIKKVEPKSYEFNNLEIITKICDEYKDEKYVYKKCNDEYNNSSREWLVVLEKLPETKTNEERVNVIDKNCAKFRGDKFKVVKIINVNDSTIQKTKIVNSFEGHKVTYEVNGIVRAEKFNQNINIVCSSGIHYFKTIPPAYFFAEIPNNFTGIFCSWYENGTKQLEGEYVDGKPLGKYTYWDEDGTKMCEGMYPEYNNGSYLRNNINGKWIWFFRNGRPNTMFDGKYFNGKKTGTYAEWYSNGIKKIEGRYENGIQNGLWLEYYRSGNKMSEGCYVNGRKNSKWTYWYDNDNNEEKSIEDFKDGELISKWISWNENK